MQRNEIENHIANALGMPSGSPQDAEFYGAFCALFGRTDLTVSYWHKSFSGRRYNNLYRIYVNAPNRDRLAMWSTGDGDSDRVEVDVEGVDGLTVRKLCAELFRLIDGHLSEGNRLAADRLGRLTPSLAEGEKPCTPQR